MAQFRKDTHQYLPDGKTIYEVVMLADQYGNLVGPANPSGTSVDAFGRARFSQPVTLFDSSHRYRDNGSWATSNTASATTVTFSSNQGVINLSLDTTADAEIIRETTKVFSYQPGKSLQVLNTFVFNPAKENLRQRVGYFGTENGIYLELDGDTLSFVKRSNTTGTVIDTKVNQSSWNIDVMDGTGPSLLTLDIEKAQIFWTDIEWLGVGSVRCGFVINGQLIHCHTFHHANLSGANTTYMTTACLPLRMEVKNTAETANSSLVKQICSSVISEGGYELRGDQRSINTAIASPYSLATAGTYYPVVSIRLKSDRTDAIVIPSAVSMLGTGNGPYYSWRIISGGTVTSASWTSAGTDSSVEYTLSGTAISGGRVIASGFVASTNQGNVPLDVLKEALFQNQLARNSLTSTREPFTLAITSDTDTTDVYGSIDWEEITK